MTNSPREVSPAPEPSAYSRNQNDASSQLSVSAHIDARELRGFVSQLHRLKEDPSSFLPQVSIVFDVGRTGSGTANRPGEPTNQRHGGFEPHLQNKAYDEKSKNKDFEHTLVWTKGKHQVWEDKDKSKQDIGFTWKDSDGPYRGWKLNPNSQDGTKGRWVLYEGSKVLGTATDVKMTSDGLSVDGKLQDLSKPTTHGPR